MLTYIAVVLTLILFAQIVRVTQNGISFYRQNKAIDKNLSGLDITNEDLRTQRRTYQLIVDLLESVEANKENENEVSFL